MRISQLIVREVRKHILENPQVIYETTGECSYHSGRCTNHTHGCIFGQVLRKMGFNVPDVVKGIDRLLMDDLRIEADHLEMKWMEAVQMSQDTKNQWGTCLVLADQAVKKELRQERENARAEARFAKN